MITDYLTSINYILYSYLQEGSEMTEGLLVLRGVAGLTIAAHGAQKLFGWFGGYGIAGTGRFFDGLGFRPGPAFAAAAGLSEFVGGLLIAAGFLGPVGPTLVLATMIVAAVTVHGRNGLFATTNGIELPLLYGTIAVALAFTGPGAYSVDAALGLTRFWTPPLAWAAVAAGTIGAFVNLVTRQTAVVEA
jgi:putative oxidoreductase